MGSSFGGGGGGSDGSDGGDGSGGDGDACQPVAQCTPPSLVTVLYYRVPRYTMHPARTLLMRSHRAKEKLPSQ